MKKQFFRVKQLADQTFSRAGKTDVLSDDLQEADRKVEYIKNSCQNLGKKLSACLLLGQLQGESGTKEKLLKKSPSYQLGATMTECGAICDDDSLMKIVLSKCGHAEKCLSEENVEHDHRVEQHVITPLQYILDNEIPNINKHKRNVTKVCLDLDSAKARYQQAQKHNSNNTTAKVETIKEELKDSEQKVEQTRDVLACEMFHLAARESDLCYTVLQYYKFQKRYHEYALSILDSLIPELENDICSSRVKPVYGVDLEEHLRVTDRKVAFPIELCVCALIELGMEEEGLFRLTGGASKLKRMKLSFDAGCMTLATALSYRDPHVIAGALKSYLRELPEPLLTHNLYDEWLNAAKAQTHPDNKLQALWTVVHKLPKANFDNLSYLIKFFHVLSKNHEVNKMSSHNLAIVIAPSLIWTKDENGSSGFGLNVNVSLYPSIIDLLVTYADWFFDKDMEFYQTLEPIMNGECEEKPTEKGIDNKAFDIKVADKMQKSLIEKSHNHSSGDAEMNLSDVKRSQSINSLSEEVHSLDSPRPITRRKNKSVAPVPPIVKDEKKKDDLNLTKDSQILKQKEMHFVNEKPDKPPRPSVSTNATLPRSTKANRENKSTETNQDDFFVQSTYSSGLIKNYQSESFDKQSSHTTKKDNVVKSVATVSTNTGSSLVRESNFVSSLDRNRERPNVTPRTVNSTFEPPEKSKSSFESKLNEYCKVDLINVKKEWLLGKDIVEQENLPLKKPAVPERPSTLKPQSFKLSRSNIDVNLRSNYENVSLSSNENSIKDSMNDRTLEKTEIYSIEKESVSLVKGDNEEQNKEEKNTCNNLENLEKESLCEEEIEKNLIPRIKDSEDSENLPKDFLVPVGERKTSVATSARPLSLPGSEKPERPPKPDYKFSSSSSHTRAFSDGQIIDIKPGDNTSSSNSNNNNNISIHTTDNSSGNSQCIKYAINNNTISETLSSSPISSTVIKHPHTSPPPPPVPAKPRSNSYGESTDF